MRLEKYSDIFPDRLKRLRGFRGLTQEQLATACGVKRNYISRLERGKRRPSFALYVKIVEALYTNTGFLLGENDDIGQGFILKGDK